jgi:hypothetical protein
MGMTFRLFVRSVLFLGILFCMAYSAAAQANLSLAGQLRANYKLAKLGTDSSGVSVIQTGTVLVVQKGGILAVPPISIPIGTAVYKDGELKGPSGFQKLALGQDVRFLQEGEKVYVLKIDVKDKEDKVILTIVECDSCNGLNQPASYKAQVAFQFPKGYLAAADAGQIQDVINQVLPQDNGGGDQQQAQGGGDQQQAPQDAAPAQDQQPQVNIERGQTIDQVVAALGQPIKTVNLGPKQIYVYKDLKITFINGRVIDVQ